jgi:hypothetical protein
MTDAARNYKIDASMSVIHQWKEQHNGKIHFPFIILKTGLPCINVSVPKIIGVFVHAYINKTFSVRDQDNISKLPIDVVASALGFNDKMIFVGGCRKHKSKEEYIIMNFYEDLEGLDEWKRTQKEKKITRIKTTN